jgi:hypothetical protein
VITLNEDGGGDRFAQAVCEAVAAPRHRDRELDAVPA